MTKPKSNVVHLFIPHTERALANEFISRYGMTRRYVSDWKRWMLFDGAVWVRDETLMALSDVADICAQDAESANKLSVQKRLLSAAMVDAVMRLVRIDQRIAAVVDQWDGDDMLLNCDGLVYSLGEDRYERPAIPGDYFTKTTRVRPGGECPRWMEFLALVTGNDGELMDYLQRVAGYCLTGSVQEQCLFFLFGPGGNGKSTFINTISRIMGDYAKTAALEMFTATRNERHPTDLADLQGARLVTATETGGRRHWDETRIKLLTGGDPIKARFMNADFFQYRPCFKLVISGNHKPSLDQVDVAMKRRVQIIPFTVEIEEGQRIRGYEEVLKEEWAGILQWMVEGAINWAKLGLAPPPAVLQATAEYLENEDVLGSWLEECTTLVADGFESRKQMYKSWADWCKRSGEYAGSRKAFVDAMKGRKGIKPHKPHRGDRGWLGIRLQFEMDGGD